MLSQVLVTGKKLVCYVYYFEHNSFPMYRESLYIHLEEIVYSRNKPLSNQPIFCILSKTYSFMCVLYPPPPSPNNVHCKCCTAEVVETWESSKGYSFPS